jgi:hypothetical protein
MHVATVIFLILLGVAHLGDADAVDRPLSLFREDRPAFGYLLFGLLALIGGLHLRTYYRLGLHRELWAPAGSLLLLAVVAATPSPDDLHTLAALLLLGLVFGWYAIRLHRVRSPWLLAHLAAPVLVLVLTAARSYGLWQKLVVVYFLLAVNIDCLLASGRLVLPGPEDFRHARRPVRRSKYSPRVNWKRNDRPPS